MPTRPAVLTQRYIFRFWIPLAIMWLMMAIEQPLLAGAIARMDEPKLQLAAFGVTFSLALLVESPIIMLLSAGTALAKGRQSYSLLLRFTLLLSGLITVLHLLVGLSPLYSWVVGELIGAPAQLVAPSRLSFVLMFPWTLAIAFRRLWQGVMIRYGKTDQVSITTLVRLIITSIVAIVGLMSGYLPGAAVAGLALSAGVIAGAVAAYLFTRPIIKGPLSDLEPPDQQISFRALLDFYIPLALTNFINFVGRPLLTLGLSRALLPLESLALWPVLMSIGFLFRSLGFAYQEVVVALLDDAASYISLRRFAVTVGAFLSALLLLIGATPLNNVWYGMVSGLAPDLVTMSQIPTLLIAVAPLTAFVIAWERGVMVNVRRTRPITVAVAINVGVLLLVFWLGSLFLALPGIAIAALAFMLANVAEMAFLGLRTRSASLQLMPITPVAT